MLTVTSAPGGADSKRSACGSGLIVIQPGTQEGAVALEHPESTRTMTPMAAMAATSRTRTRHPPDIAESLDSKGYYLSLNKTRPLRLRSNFRIASVCSRGANGVRFMKPKSFCNSVGHRSLAAQNHIQVSAMNAVVLRKSALTSLAFNCCFQQINDVAAGENNFMDVVIGLKRHGTSRRRHERSSVYLVCGPFVHN